MPGARSRCYAFAHELTRRGYPSRVVSLADQFGAPDGCLEATSSRFRKLWLSLRAGLAMMRTTNSIWVMNRVHYHSLGLLPYLAFFRKKIVLDLDDWEMRDTVQRYGGVVPRSRAEFLTSVFAKRSHFAIGASQYLCDFLRTRVPSCNVVCIPSGVDTELFRSYETNRITVQAMPAEHPVVFFWMGTINREDDIINCASMICCFQQVRLQVPSCQLQVFGYGCYVSRVEALCCTEGISFQGWVPHDQMPGRIQGLDVGLVPLVRDTPFNQSKSPVKLFEMMASGKPVIASRIGECCSVIDDGCNGFLASNEQEFIAKMIQLAKDPRERQAMGKRARLTVQEKYSLKGCVDTLVDSLHKHGLLSKMSSRA